MTTAAASSAAAISPRPGWAFPCRSTGTCRAPRPGALRPSASTARPTTTRWPWRWCCTTCPSTTTASTLTTVVVDAWGLPVARITLTPHQNDLDQGRCLIDRSAEILEAAGARKRHQGLCRAHHRQLLAPARHDPHGQRSGDVGAEPLVPGTRGRQSLRRWTARPSRPRPARTPRSPSWPTPGGCRTT